MPWICPNCGRTFKTPNQSHTCSKVELDELFADRPDELILTFDKLLLALVEWPEVTVGTGKSAIIFTRNRAFLIVRPMRKELDLKFYHTEQIQGAFIKKVSRWAKSKKLAHHIRVSHPEQLTQPILRAIHRAYEIA